MTHRISDRWSGYSAPDFSPQKSPAQLRDERFARLMQERGFGAIERERGRGQFWGGALGAIGGALGGAAKGAIAGVPLGPAGMIGGGIAGAVGGGAEGMMTGAATGAQQGSAAGMLEAQRLSARGQQRMDPWLERDLQRQARLDRAFQMLSGYAR